jgi:hypothetical protein
MKKIIIIIITLFIVSCKSQPQSPHFTQSCVQYHVTADRDTTICFPLK